VQVLRQAVPASLQAKPSGHAWVVPGLHPPALSQVPAVVRVDPEQLATLHSVLAPG